MKYEIKHGGARTKLYLAWSNMKGRCYRKSMKGYKNYGGRGINVCDEWRHSFPAFREWALTHGYVEEAESRKFTLDRIDVNGDYSPDNCRWIDNKSQQNNKRNNRVFEYKGKKKTVAQWAEECGLGYKAMQKRLNHWSVEDAIETKPLKREDRSGRATKKSRRVLQLSKDGIVLNRFESVSEAARSVNRAPSEIHAVCSGKKNSSGYPFRTCGGFCWKFDGGDKNEL